jgi:hypothetical protein
MAKNKTFARLYTPTSMQVGPDACYIIDDVICIQYAFVMSKLTQLDSFIKRIKPFNLNQLIICIKFAREIKNCFHYCPWFQLQTM